MLAALVACAACSNGGGNGDGSDGGERDGAHAGDGGAGGDAGDAGQQACLPGSPGSTTTITAIDLGDGSTFFDGPYILDVCPAGAGAAVLYAIEDATRDGVYLSFIDPAGSARPTLEVYGGFHVDSHIIGRLSSAGDKIHVAVADRAKAVLATVEASTQGGVSGTTISRNNYLAINSVSMLGGTAPLVLVYQHLTDGDHVLSAHGPHGSGEELVVGTWSLDAARRLIGRPQLAGELASPWVAWLETAPIGCRYWQESCQLALWAMPLRAGGGEPDAVKLAEDLPAYDWWEIDAPDKAAWLPRSDGALLALDSDPYGQIAIWSISTGSTTPSAAPLETLTVDGTLERFWFYERGAEPGLIYLTNIDNTRCCYVSGSSTSCSCREGHIAGDWWDVAIAGSAEAIRFFTGTLARHLATTSTGVYAARLELTTPTPDGTDPTAVVVQRFLCRE